MHEKSGVNYAADRLRFLNVLRLLRYVKNRYLEIRCIQPIFMNSFQVLSGYSVERK